MVKIGKEATKLIETGIDGLDSALGGGLPDSTLFLVIGEAGSHYETFVQQILYNHALRGGKVAYYTIEISSLDIRDDMAIYGWDVDKLPDDSWIFVNVQTPDLQELSQLAAIPIEGHRIPLSTTLTSLKSDFLSRAKGGRWTAMHMSHLLLRYDFRDVLDTVLYMRLVVRHYHGLHFIVVPRGIHEDQKINAIKHLVDGVVEFSMQERAREYEGSLTIRKLRKVLHRTRTFPFIVSEKGIVVERAERII
ncbi:MAG: ATPase domain-containing protein [Candidatus Bathyarchaeia archaeon]